MLEPVFTGTAGSSVRVIFNYSNRTRGPPSPFRSSLALPFLFLFCILSCTTSRYFSFTARTEIGAPLASTFSGRPKDRKKLVRILNLLISRFSSLCFAYQLSLASTCLLSWTLFFLYARRGWWIFRIGFAFVLDTLFVMSNQILRNERITSSNYISFIINTFFIGAGH